MKKKIALITGASQGIGRGLAEVLAKNNWRVILVARNEEKLKDFLSTYGSDHQFFSTDLSDTKSTMDLIDAIKRDHDQLDLLINCAGVGNYKNFESISFEEWQKSYQLNLFSIFLLTNHLLPLLKNSADSLVMNIGSICGVNPVENRTVYCSTKFALRGLSLVLSEEFKNKKPDFSLITLGSTMTSFGSLSLEEKKQAQKNGKKYLKLEDVVIRLYKVITSKNRRSEYTILP